MRLYWVVGSDTMFIWNCGLVDMDGQLGAISEKGLSYLESRELIYFVGNI